MGERSGVEKLTRHQEMRRRREKKTHAVEKGLTEKQQRA
jgi:hypothetical protein